jgi:hypothetical protein
MAIRLSIDDKDINKAKLFVAAINNQLPFATSVALNNVAFNVRRELGQQTTRSFASPTKFTQNAFKYNKATKANLEAQVYAEPNRRFFPTQIKGGERRPKPYEGYLRGLSGGGLPTGGRLVPTPQVLNAAGNPKKSIFSTIANKLSTTDQGGIFIGVPKGGGTAGVYRRSRGQLYPYFLHVNRTQYEPRFPMERVGMETARRLFPIEMNKAVEKALKSAR